MTEALTQRIEGLGPAESIIQTLVNHTDHIYHGRPGMVVKDTSAAAGVRWFPVTHVKSGEEPNIVKTVYRLEKKASGKGSNRILVGILGPDNMIRKEGTGEAVAEYREPGIFPEVATYLYGQVAKVWEMDQEFVARWASYSFRGDHRDIKMVMAAFMLVQNRYGAPFKDEKGNVIFYDDNYREVGEAICLARKNGLQPKQLLRLFDFLKVPGVAQINRDLGFTTSLRNPATGFLKGAVRKWLSFREKNISVLQGLVDNGGKQLARDLARRSNFKPEGPEFFKTLGWKQKQGARGNRQILDIELPPPEDWSGLSETEVCLKIMADKPNYKRLVSLVPADVGITRSVMVAAIESGGLSDTDLLIYSPKLEDLGLLDFPAVKQRRENALKGAKSMRAANIAKRMNSQGAKEEMEAAADNAAKKAVAKVVKDMRIYFIIDISISMHEALVQAKEILPNILQAIPAEKLHVSVFNSYGREVEIKHASSAGVAASLSKYRASGGTSYGQGVLALQHKKPSENEDVLFIFIGDQADNNSSQDFSAEVRASGLRPQAFGLIELTGQHGQGVAVENTAFRLGIPCFKIDKHSFDDASAIPRVLSHLIDSTPIRQVGSNPVPVRRRTESLVEKILKTDILTRPAWASVLSSSTSPQ